MSNGKYVIGLDYGTDSCRAVVVDASTGKEMASAVQYYPRWMAGKYCNPVENQYRQHPADYTDTLEAAVKEALALCPAGTAEQVAAIAFDTTGSTPVLTDREGTPLALLPQHAENPNAMFVLWKDHTALREATEINELAATWETDYTLYEGGIYSAEWVWAKMLHVLRQDEGLRKDAYAWIEHCDWMPAILTGKVKPEEVVRSRCAAGHKALWHESWGGLPPEEFLTTLDPLLAGLRSHLYQTTCTADTKVGTLTKEWAAKLGLSTQVAVAAGTFDCHAGAVGAGITPKTFVRVMGTSTCDIMVASRKEMENRVIPGICGQVDGSVIPGITGLEAGQSAFGDVYAWFKQILAWPIEQILSQTTLVDENTRRKLVEETTAGIIPLLSEEAAKIPPEACKLIATDWLNGRRTPYASQYVKGTVAGLTLGTSAPLLYRALVEATAFGSKAIVERFLQSGIEIEQVIAIGGITKKSQFVLQTLSDVLQMPILVAAVEQACAFGAAMYAAVAGGIYINVEDAQAKMGQGISDTYTPNEAYAEHYRMAYESYKQLGAFTEANFFNP